MNSNEMPGELSPPAAPPGPAEPLPSLPARLFGALFSPGATFRRIVDRPLWSGAFAVYLVIVVSAMLVYSLNVDWEAMMRSSFENSVGWKLMSSIMSEGQLAEAERVSLNQVLSVGRAGLALQTTINAGIGTLIVFHFLAVLFATLFYLMGALADLRLGRVYLDGFLCFLVIILFGILSFMVRAAFGENSLGALPYQAGLASLFFVGYFLLFRRSVDRQPDFRRLIAAYAHAMAVPGLAMVVMAAVILLKQDMVTVAQDQVVASNLGAILSITGTGPLAVLLGSLDLFTLWTLIIASIGFAAATRLSTGTSVAITFLPWGFFTMARLAMAAAFGG